MIDDSYKPYSEWAPTGVDPKGLALEDRQDWLVCPIGTNRDADLLTRSNWECFNAELIRLDPDGEEHESHEFNHWACGWFGIVLVKPNGKVYDAALRMTNAMSDYPVLSYEHFSELEEEEKCAAWRQASIRDRIEWLKKARMPIWGARKDDMPSYSDDQGALGAAILGH